MNPERIPPDTKDWTWVLDAPCPECGFVASDVEVDQVCPTIRASIPRWTSALMRPDARVRPVSTTWSTLEYGAHVRDVFGVFAARLELMLQEEDPDFADWDQDAAAVQGGYENLDPVVVAVELEEAARSTADLFDAVVPHQVERRGRRSNGSEFTVRTLSRYFVHDVLHHLHDVGA